MKAKLIKRDVDYYYLQNDEGIIAFYSDKRQEHSHYKLSLKNCQAIERGYDLDEFTRTIVIKSVINEHGNHSLEDWEVSKYSSFVKLGFQTAMELMGDKQFSEEDIKKMMKRATYGWFESDFDKHLDSIRQTEWDVEIEMEPYHDGNFVEDGKTHSFEPKWRPKLDANGCLILKLDS